MQWEKGSGDRLRGRKNLPDGTRYNPYSSRTDDCFALVGFMILLNLKAAGAYYKWHRAGADTLSTLGNLRTRQ